MSYFAPYLDGSGFHYPTYNDIIAQLVDDAQTIYGSGVYLGSDSQDYQLLSKVAEKIYDCYQTCETVYHSHSPATAMGAALDYAVALNGLVRKQGTRSTARVKLTGTPGTHISNGRVADIGGRIWVLPESVQIAANGSASVMATCVDVGVIQASPGDISRIMTPTLGWQSVTNPDSATTGTVTETDAELRARQADSVAQPTRSIVQGLRSALRSIKDVNRCVVYENDQKIPDANGIPGNSICAVVEGGADGDIARTLLNRKGMGCGTYGDSRVTIYDGDGQSYDICFMRPKQVDIDIDISIKRFGDYTPGTPEAIANALMEYLAKFSIGADVSSSLLWMIAQQVSADPHNPTFAVTSLTCARHGEALSADDIVIGFDEVAHGNAGYISVQVA